MSEEMSLDQVLAQYEDVAREANLEDNDWMPPQGTYTCLLGDLTNGVKQKENGPFAWFKATCRILDTGDHENKSFPVFMGIGTFKDGSAGTGLKNFLRLASCIAGVEIHSLAAAKAINEYAAQSGECILRVRTFNLKNGNVGVTFQSCEQDIDGIDELLTALELDGTEAAEAA